MPHSFFYNNPILGGGQASWNASSNTSPIMTKDCSQFMNALAFPASPHVETVQCSQLHPSACPAVVLLPVRHYEQSRTTAGQEGCP